MIERYTLPEMGRLWSEENKLAVWLEVEVAVCEAQAERGIIPKESLKIIKEKAGFDIERVKEIEQETRHDLVAFLKSVQEKIGEEGRWMHRGLTSYDVEDTALAILIRESCTLILDKLRTLSDVLKERALENKRVVMMGRTHGVHAEPTTLGLKFLSWFDEVRRHIRRLRRVKKEISCAKISGAVGNFAHIDPIIEELVARRLGLFPTPISTQIIDRDRHAQYLTGLAVLASSIEKFATEIRSRQRTEIGELEEPFRGGQIGSSAMPHKRNPIVSERLCGLARIVRANALAALQNIALWDERDISHSSVERVVLPDSSIAVDYMVDTFTQLMRGLVTYPGRMTRNVEATRGLIFSEVLLLKLIDKGLDRNRAYSLVQRNAIRTHEMGLDFAEEIRKDEDIAKAMNKEEIDECFNVHHFLRNVEEIYRRVLSEEESD
ncbi:MAG: adenylosuccinate lyase [Latescibacteria bacterium DG_63]|nr:MAG: adenylosuccinate lyase [Latescibacteria bacterium DG_63]